MNVELTDGEIKQIKQSIAVIILSPDEARKEAEAIEKVIMYAEERRDDLVAEMAKENNDYE